MRIRGWINLAADAVSGNSVGLKLLYAETNDAGTMTGDHSGIDTQEEDVAVRQLWTAYYVQQTVASTDALRVQTYEVDIKAKLKLEASSKKQLVLLMTAASANRTESSGYLRCLLLHG